MARMLSLDPDEIKRPENEDGGNFQSSSWRGNWKLIGLVIFFLFYLAFGASIFSAIESPYEKQEVSRLMERKLEFLKQHPDITDSSLDDLISEIVDANNRGVNIASNGSSVPSWSFGQAFFFASTVVTTIGYGHQSPLSAEGKSFCIIYALIGIPMTLLLLTAVVERLLLPIGLALRFLNNRLGHRYTALTIRILHLSLLILSVVVFLFLIPAAIFTSIESHWTYLDSLYYCFISLTTVGLGDFIPGDSPDQSLRPLYKACTTFYLLIGVTAMTLTLSVIYSVPEFDMTTFFLISCASGKSGMNLNGANGSSADPERIRLHSSGSTGPMYTQQQDERSSLDPHNRTTVVRARSRPNEDSPSPSEVEPPEPGASGKVRLR